MGIWSKHRECDDYPFNFVGDHYERMLSSQVVSLKRENALLREMLEKQAGLRPEKRNSVERQEKEYAIEFLENYLSELERLRDRVPIEDLSSDETRTDIFACILNNMSRVKCDIKKLKEELNNG